MGNPLDNLTPEQIEYLQQQAALAPLPQFANFEQREEYEDDLKMYQQKMKMQDMLTQFEMETSQRILENRYKSTQRGKVEKYEQKVGMQTNKVFKATVVNNQIVRKLNRDNQQK